MYFRPIEKYELYQLVVRTENGPQGREGWIGYVSDITDTHLEITYFGESVRNRFIATEYQKLPISYRNRVINLGSKFGNVTLYTQTYQLSNSKLPTYFANYNQSLLGTFLQPFLMAMSKWLNNEIGTTQLALRLSEPKIEPTNETKDWFVIGINPHGYSHISETFHTFLTKADALHSINNLIKNYPENTYTLCRAISQISAKAETVITTNEVPFLQAQKGNSND